MSNNINRMDTGDIQKAIGMRTELLETYDSINTDFDRSVKELLENWKGKGAKAFEKDAKTVRANVTGLNDILKTMCDMLEDCLDVFKESDASLKEFNENPQSE